MFHGPLCPNVPAKVRPALLWELGLISLGGSARGRFNALPTQVCSTKEVFCSLLQALYDHLMDFLADRGVDNTFADELIELSTALEHQEYIKFLEDLKSFVKCQ